MVGERDGNSFPGLEDAVSDSRWRLHDEFGEDGFRHIWPEEDIYEHELLGVNCWCHPSIDLEFNLVIHNRVQ